MHVILLSILLVFNPSIPDEKDLKGKWTPYKAENENGEPCEDKMIEDFWIKFKSKNRFEMQQKNWKGGEPKLSEGKFKVTDKEIVMTYWYQPRVEVDWVLPIYEYSKDNLVVGYNMCMTDENADLGKVYFKRGK